MNGSGLTASDVLAMTKDRDGLFGGDGIGFIILLFIFIWAVFGGNGFLGNNRTMETLTQAELQAGLYNQTTDRNLSDIRTAQCNTDMLINNASYNSLIQSKDLSAQIASCCCENRLAMCEQTNTLANAIHAEGEATRNMIQNDKIEQLREQIYTTNLALNNANLANQIINSVRPTPTPAYLTCSPYFAYNTPSCNGCNSLY